MHSSVVRLALGLMLCVGAAVLSVPARGEMPAVVEITTGNDIVYGGPMRYLGYRLRGLTAPLSRPLQTGPH